MKAYIEQDLVIGQTNASNGVNIPDDLKTLPQEQLRFNGTDLIDAIGITSFYIDSRGRKHITKFDSSWQQLSCKFDDELSLDNNVWKVVSKLSVYQDKMYAQFKRQLYAFIIKGCDFPEWKQVNYLDRYYELDSKSNPSPAEQTELNGLKSVRVWKNNLLAYRDIIKSSIYNATTTSDVDSATANVTFTNPPFDL